MLADGCLFVGRTLGCVYESHGSVLIVSTPAQTLHLYEVYTSQGDASMGPYLHEWTYAGTVYEVFSRQMARAKRRNVLHLLGLCAEFYAFGTMAAA